MKSVRTAKDEFADWQSEKKMSNPNSRLKSVLLVACLAAGVITVGCGKTGTSTDRAFVNKILESSTQEIQSVSELIEQADEAIAAGEIDRAKKSLTEAIMYDAKFADQQRLKNSMVDAYEKRARCFVSQSLYQSTIQDLTSAINLEPSAEITSRLFLMRAQSQKELGNWVQVKKDCLAAISHNPDTKAAYGLCGEAFEAMSDLPSAISYFKKAGNPRESELVTVYKKETDREAISYFSAGTNQFQAGQFEDAASFFEQAVADSPDDPNVYLYLAKTYNRLDEHFKAKQACNKSIINGGHENSEVYYLRGISQMEDRRYDSAVQDFEMAKKLDPNLVGDVDSHLENARKLGGMPTQIRQLKQAEIQQEVNSRLISSENRISENERWLVDLISQTDRTLQVRAMLILINRSERIDADSMQWFAEFLLCGGYFEPNQSLRTALGSKVRKYSPKENLVKSLYAVKTAALVQSKFEIHPDLISYAIANEYDKLLKTVVDRELDFVDLAHLYHAIDYGTPMALDTLLRERKFLVDAEIEKLFDECIADEKYDHCKVIVAQRSNLNQRVLDFLQSESGPELLPPAVENEKATMGDQEKGDQEKSESKK